MVSSFCLRPCFVSLEHFLLFSFSFEDSTLPLPCRLAPVLVERLLCHRFLPVRTTCLFMLLCFLLSIRFCRLLALQFSLALV